VPTYDYVCSACGHEIEVVHGVHGHGPSHCPVCGGTMRKSISAPAVHFKGSGWAKKERAGSGRGGPESAPPASKGGTSSESTGSTGSTGSTDTAGTSEGRSVAPSAAGSSGATD
jgi:putative FmdB family regulatory protein